MPIHRFLIFALLGLSMPFVAQAADRYVTLNEGQHVHLGQEIGKVFISNPAVADYKVIDKHTLVVYANQVGQARFMVYGKEENLLLSDRIIVDVNLDLVRKQLKFRYPDLDIQLTSIGEQVAVRGTVESIEQRDEIYRLVANLLGREKITRWNSIDKYTFESDSGDVTAPEDMIFAKNHTWQGIIEQLQVATVQQVNVKVSIAQVTKGFDSTIGVDWSSDGSDTGVFSLTQFKAGDLSTLITALDNDDIAKILAEPNLTVLSGESASFLVGGEVPIIITSDGTVSVSFKEYGIKLNLTAKVLSEDKIRMQLNPEVSEVDQYIEADGIEVPQLSTRRALTTVELGDGESFVLGGLMNNTDYEAIQKVPLLGDIPILGALFKKAQTERTKTEIVIVATVNLVKPTRASEIELPDIERTTSWSRLLHDGNKKHHDKPGEATARLLAQGGFIE
ncbi:pilus assembly protein N-terminal domain-containing protein [Vibrio sp. HB161653]|uniref:Pilus assembly protein N-terminal domain-containing protein n=2 Tax=unclassified Vibrio TaxID=2614977 RepID=A0AB39HMY3_9VIBR|nr:pilus assembly protein N-terminal domain-containing protein [Vibrio sp. HB161653]MDP5253176.1 pilus assembly protein N-terminal domain-containing protein [Vibrio sp. HB161653]